MRRFLTILLCGAMLLTAFAAPAAATPTDELTALARFFPEKTLFFASVRTDDDFFAMLDDVINLIEENMPEEVISEPDTIEELLDQMIAPNPNIDGGFSEAIRPWLGNTAAIGFPSLTELLDDNTYNDLSGPVLLAAEITDRAGVEAFFDQIIPDEAPLNIEQIPDYTLITPDDPDNDSAIYIGNEVLLITNSTALLPQDTITGSLRDAADFTNSLSYLPESEYSAVVYINMPEFLRQIIVREFDPEELVTLGRLSPLMEGIGGQVWGATILEGRSIVLDIAQPITDPSIYEEIGMSVPSSTPISYDFARFIPAGTPFVIQSTDLNSVYKTLIDSYRRTIEMMEVEGSGSGEELERSLEQMEFAIRGMTGLDLEDDILSWMTGNYALAFGFSPALEDLPRSGIPSSFPVEFGFLVEATDAEAAQAVVDGIAQALSMVSSDDFTLTEETFGDVTAQVISASDDDLPFPVEFVFGASDEVFIFGTPRMAEAALNPGDGLAADPSYVEMQEFALDEPTTLYYLSGEGLTPLVNGLVVTRSVNEWDEDAIKSLFRLLSSSSVSTTMLEDGSVLYRMVLTLPE